MKRSPDLADLERRWQHARLSALRGVAGRRDDESEAALTERAFEVDAPEAARKTFENSLVLGKGFARVVAPVGFDEVPEVLGALKSPCHQGAWRAVDDEPGFVLERAPCGAPASVCDKWREAADGLVLGLTGDARSTRHRSGGRGDDTCVDVVYLAPDSPLRYGFIPEAMATGLAAVARFLNQMKGTEVRFLGVSEGVLLYELDVDGCGGGPAVNELLSRAVKSRWPTLELRDVSPRAVLGLTDSTDSHPEAP
ncbi:MAG: hypothetical protein IAE78_22795 [Myxococcus sp.]|nr:hypothetical protein [Myxococcus sp.]